ncbi:MAG: DegT/DnrJ/EryC1/StrS family aminotransferase [Bacteroidales bacterium]
MDDQKIYVTRPSLPPLEEYVEYLEKIWGSRVLTNNGPFHQQFEEELADYLGVKYVSLFTNGTLALVTALQALRITGEVITTPFSFVATTHALWWNRIKPVFADIEPETFTLDPEKVEAAITPATTAILPVHVYGYPCRVKELDRIAKKYGLKLIYDAAHTFGARLNGTSLCHFGDLSILSFHATKVFNTFEGGAIVCHDAEMKNRIDHLKNFGFDGETSVIAPGINAKMNEFQAALGLLQLKYIEGNIEKRKQIATQYHEQLHNVKGIRLPTELPGLAYNYAYYPVLIDENEFGKSRDKLYQEMRNNSVYARRYFYPLISNLPMYKGLISAQPYNLQVSNQIAEKIICLPIYPNLGKDIIEQIIIKTII